MLKQRTGYKWLTYDPRKQDMKEQNMGRKGEKLTETVVMKGLSLRTTEDLQVTM